MELGRTLVAAVALWALVHPLVGHASVQPVRWVSETINWCYDPADAPDGLTDRQVRKAIRAALKVWSDEVDLPFARRETDRCDERTPSLIRVKWVYKQSNWTGRAIITKERISTPSGRLLSQSIVAAEILLNEANLVEAGRLQVGEMQQVLVHEIGHAIGLEHSDDERSIMYPTVHAEMAFNKSDATALRELYGRRYQPRPDGTDERTLQASNR